MEIEIITTKKKLTQSIVNQIPFASPKDKEYIVETENSIFGYVKIKYEDFIIARGLEDLVKIRAIEWKDSSTFGSKNLYSGDRSISFLTVEEKNSWLSIHNRILKQGKLVHIYL